ncbi:hypothetical protein AVEN_261789-1 [Araneus ventricosus]|uniref:Uncharacterized protein n=1 Tax=Araneus ventricosus TaxID=182803 RepID=A0A4Y2M1V0_ARAVE|nr:hypothetical protein AVEN_261789-1 [Araneus ventricosus]
MVEREETKNWDCHRALVKVAVERERQIMSHMMKEVEDSLGDILFHLRDTERWKNAENVVKELQFEREYLIRIIQRLMQFQKTIVTSLHHSTQHLIHCMDDKFETDTELIDVSSEPEER